MIIKVILKSTIEESSRKANSKSKLNKTKSAMKKPVVSIRSGPAKRGHSWGDYVIAVRNLFPSRVDGDCVGYPHHKGVVSSDLGGPAEQDFFVFGTESHLTHFH